MSNPEEKLLQFPPWWFRPFPHPGDPIDMEFVLRDLEEPIRNIGCCKIGCDSKGAWQYR